MAYMIQYAQTALRIDLDNKKKKKASPWSKRFVLLLSLIAAVYLLQTDAVQEYLIPGNKEITKEAWHQMNKSMEEGESFSEAFRVFCQEVVQNSETS